jgi:RNA polymerase sigma-70 factor (ECF subfamily)
VLEYRAELLRFLRARRAADEEAEDVIQDLFLKVGTLQSGPIGEPRAYLYRISANILSDRRRSAARRANRERIWTEIQPGADDPGEEVPSIEQEMIARDELNRILAAISALPERTAEILRLYRIDGIPQKDIAMQIGISLSAVEKHLQRGYLAVIRARAELDADIPLPRRSLDEGANR